MRQGQQNRRGRGRSTSRKGQNPLTRSFESTGPDVKIRGTPAHIAEKYMSLARDATSSGDPVLAENYLQHAEHYNRIIMSFRDQNVSQGGDSMMNGGTGRHRAYMASDANESGDEFSEEEIEDGDVQPPHPPMRQHESQPRVEGQRGGYDQQRQRGRRDPRPERAPGAEPRGFDAGRPQNAEGGADGGPQRGPSPGGQDRRGERVAQSHEQPEFLRRPVRRPRRDSNGGSDETNGGTVADKADRD